MVRSLVDRLRKPAYTGRNRCYPCTAINVALVGAVGVLVGAVVVPAGVVVVAVGLAAVWLRGYVVPGTPRLTRRYLPDRLLAAVGKSPGGVGPSAGSIPETDDPTELLAGLGVVDPDEPSLSARFRDSWAATADRIAGDEAATREAAAAVLSVRPATLAVDADEHGGVRLTVEGDWAGDWPSRTALVADLAAELTLDGDAWAALDRTTRADLTARIRGLATTCPVCGGETTVSDDTVESCCRSVDVVAVTCRGCGDRLAEFERSPAPFAPGA